MPPDDDNDDVTNLNNQTIILDKIRQRHSNLQEFVASPFL